MRHSAWAVWQAYADIVQAAGRIVHVQHELFAFGSLASALMLPTMLAALRRRGLKLITTIHGVIPLSQVSDDFVKANRIPGNASTAKILWRTLLRKVALSSDVVHVHEPFLRDLLVDEYGLSSTTVRVIPHGVEPSVEKADRIAARTALNIPANAEVALFFGYLSAYKGIEYLLAELASLLSHRPRLHILIAGAVPSRLAGSINPQAVVERLTFGRERVHLHGFVADSDTPQIFGAADVMLLPYRVAMSSSGPLSFAIGFDVPVIMSEAFQQPFPAVPCFFALTPGALTRALQRFFEEPGIRSQSSDFIAELRATRSWSRVARLLTELYNGLRVGLDSNQSVNRLSR